MTERNTPSEWMPGSAVTRPWLAIVIICAGLLSAVVDVPLVVSVWNSPSAHGRSKGPLLALLIVVPAGLLFVGTLKAGWDRRLNGVLRLHPAALVSTVARSRDTTAAINSVRQPAAQPVKLPKYMTIVADSDGVQLWGGVLHQAMLWKVDWGMVSSVDPGSVRYDSAARSLSTSVVVFLVMTPSGEVRIPLGFIGTRSWGFFAAKPLETLRIADTLQALRKKRRV